jgi:hypothetical protein
MSKIKIKKKIKPILELKFKYKTTYKDIKKYFDYLNEGIFANKLIRFNEIEIRNLKRQKCVGQVVTIEDDKKGTVTYKLEMDTHYDTKKDFLDTLAHEMVHLYQFMIRDNGNHNKLFYSFKSKLNYIGLKL